MRDEREKKRERESGKHQGYKRDGGKIPDIVTMDRDQNINGMIEQKKKELVTSAKAYF